MHSSWVVDAIDHSAPPYISTLALFLSTSSHILSQFHMELSHGVFPRPVFRVPTSNSLFDNPHDKKLSHGTVSTFVDLAFINSCLYLGTHSNFLLIIYFMISSRSVSHNLSVMTLFPTLSGLTCVSSYYDVFKRTLFPMTHRLGELVFNFMF